MRVMSTSEAQMQTNDDAGEVTVTAPYYGGGLGGSGGGGSGGPPPGGASMPYGQGDNPPKTTGPDVYVPPHECTDAQAAQIAKGIAAEFNDTIQEYQAGIWESPDGVIHTTPLITSGSSTDEATNPFQNVTMPYGSIILGTVHNHDLQGGGGGIPSSPGNAAGPEGDDYSLFQYYAQYNNANGQVGAGAGSFHEYIVDGGTGTLYEYNSNNIDAATNQGAFDYADHVRQLGNIISPDASCPGQ